MNSIIITKLIQDLRGLDIKMPVRYKTKETIIIYLILCLFEILIFNKVVNNKVLMLDSISITGRYNKFVNSSFSVVSAVQIV